MANFQIKKFLAPTDILPISIVIGGLLLTIFMDITAFRLIGIGISIIGIISLFMIISQRMGEYVDTRYKSKTPPPNFNITTKKDTNAKRQTFEDFADSMKREDKKEMKEVDSSNSGDDGFKIISKKSTQIKTDSKTDNKSGKNTKNEHEVKNIAKSIDAVDNNPKIVVKLEQSKLVFGSDDELPEIPENYNPIVKKIKESKKEEELSNKSQPDKIDDKDKTDYKVNNSEANPNDKSVSESFQSDIGNKNENSKVQEVAVKEKNTTEKTTKKETRKIEGLSAEFLKQDPIDNLSDPKNEFEYCINRILNAIKSVGSIGTTALFMVNHQNNKYKLDSFSSNFPEDKITEKKKFDFGTDIISQIIKNSKPEILSEINPSSETELITYYNEKVGVSSFIGVPIYYREEIIGVLTADSEYTDGFDASTVNYLSHFTRLIAVLLHNYVEKYELSQSKITLDALNKFRITDYNFNDNNLTIEFFASVIKLLDFSFGGIVSFSEDKWQIDHFVPDNISIVTTNEINKDSLIYKVIETNSPIFKKAIEPNEVLIEKNETLPKFKKIAILPIQSSGVVHAAIFLGTNRIEELSDNDLELLELICEHVGSAYEKLSLIKELESSSHINSRSGVLNFRAYNDRLEIEHSRALEYNRELSLCVINIDDYQAYKDDSYEEKLSIMYENCLKIINKLKRKFDIIAINDKNQICLILPETKLDSAKFWAEKFRNEVATSILVVDNKKFNQTVSIGISSIINSKTSEELIQNSDTALKHSIEKTNTVTIFN